MVGAAAVKDKTTQRHHTEIYTYLRWFVGWAIFMPTLQRAEGIPLWALCRKAVGWIELNSVFSGYLKTALWVLVRYKMSDVVPVILVALPSKKAPTRLHYISSFWFQCGLANVETSSSVLVDECEQVEVTMTVTRVMMSGVSAGLVSLSLIIVTSLTRRIITRVSTQQHKEPRVH